MVVRVTDANGVAVSGQIVNFVVVSGRGTVFAGTAQTNAQGEARERWTLGTVAGEQTIEARAVDQTTGDPIIFADITATADPGSVASLQLSPSLRIFLNQQVDLATLVSASDQYGNAITDPPLTATTEPPFQIEGTTFSSAVEAVGPVTLTSGAVSAAAVVTVLRDLNELVGATGTWSCDGSQMVFPGPVFRTHRSSTFAVDSVQYYRFATEERVRIFTTYSDVSTVDGAIVKEDGHGGLTGRQQFGAIVWVEEGGSGLIGTATLISDAPLSYVGGRVCGRWDELTHFDPITITK